MIMSEANTPGYSKKADPKDRLEYLKMEQTKNNNSGISKYLRTI